MSNTDDIMMTDEGRFDEARRAGQLSADSLEAIMAEEAQLFPDVQLRFVDDQVPPPELDPEKFPFPWDAIPRHMRPGLAAYLRYGADPGLRWHHILSGCLHCPGFSMDDADWAAFGGIIRFLKLYMPPHSWGSPEIVKSWMTWMNANRTYQLAPKYAY